MADPTEPIDPNEAQAAAELANLRLNKARETLNTAGSIYQDQRRYAPRARQTDKARAAWGLALVSWAQHLIAREEAADRLTSARRDAAELDRMQMGSGLKGQP